MHCGVRLPRSRVRRDLSGAGYVAGDTPALAATQRHLCSRRGRDVVGVSLDLARTRGATEWGSRAIPSDKVQSLRGVERRRARLAHDASSNALQTAIPDCFAAPDRLWNRTIEQRF